MLFHSFNFLLFFSVTFAVYWSLSQHRQRMLWLLVASAVFYALWHPWVVCIILFTAGVDFVLARRMEDAPSVRSRRRYLVVSLVVSLGLLAFFKYTNFLLDSASSILETVGVSYVHAPLEILLPLGISFYTFETISYMVDVYRGRLRAERSFPNYALFIMFFPHLISGPIVRPRSFLAQVRRIKRFDWLRVDLGARLFLLGLIKKAVIADNMAAIVDPVFAAPSAYGSDALWIAVGCYTIQIYCDFSGYTDMALGAAHALGFKLPLNFNLPYAAASISEFWHRWHISLSTWLRDYLYVPLGGSRYGPWKTCRNLFVTMGLAGLWHGAGWPFVLCGLYHGVLLVVHRVLPTPTWFAHERFKPVKIVLTVVSVALGFVFFRAQSLADVWTIFHRLAPATEGLSLSGPDVLVAALALSAVLIAHLVTSYVDMADVGRRLPAPVTAVGMAVVFMAVQLLMPESGTTFVYFQF